MNFRQINWYRFIPSDRDSDRRQQLGIDFNFYVELVNQVFWEKNPSLKGRKLSDDANDDSLRAEWDKTAAELLDKLAPLSKNARQQLGNYTAAQRDRAKAEVNEINTESCRSKRLSA